MTVIQHDAWARLWLAELERRTDRSPQDASLIRDRLARARERTEVLHARARDGSEAFAGMAEHRHPLTGQREIVLSHLAAERPSALRELLAKLPVGGQAAALETAGVPGDEIAAIMRQASFEPHVLTLRHRTVPQAPLPKGPLDIHVARTAELGFVYDCLATALGRGLYDESTVTDLREWARSKFELTGTSVCLVGTLDGRPVCHGLGVPRPDRYSGGKVLYVVDVFVIPEEHSRGFSRMVSAALLRRAAERGHQVLESDLVIGPNSDKLLDGLRDAGWVADRLRWRRAATGMAR
ncbi:GNAT family N-acetyltransferase [Streptomyces sp. NPDC053750]|uniref:GNAT family N-acetyltransferase n=1 Tax=Streptomyces sp. NPDC053750 TaxID=3365714 RepID=UPI0037D64DEB